MKTPLISAVAIALALGSSAIARQAPAPTPPTPPTPPATHHEAITGRMLQQAYGQSMKTEKAAFLGVGVRPADAALLSQLDLPRGIGLIVFFVEPDSPAATAGLQEHDLLHKIDDQLLVNAQQLATLVRTYKPGDEVTLTVIRKGKPQTLKAKLIEKELPMLTNVDAMIRINGEPVLPDPAGFNVGQMRVFAAPPDSDPFAIRENRIIRVQPGSKSQIVRKDGKQTIELNTVDGKTTLRITDADGNETFKGPFNSPEDEAKVPEEVREKVKQMQDGIEMKVMPATQPAGEPKADAMWKAISGGC